jgi:hypothetical protein
MADSWYVLAPDPHIYYDEPTALRAEQEVFPVTDTLKMPVIAYTALPWGE